MKRLIIVVALCVASSAYAHHEEEIVINQASELVSWCKDETEARYVAKGLTPYQWAASHHEKSNVLHVDGRLRVHNEDVAVRCRIARGAREKYAVIEIDDPSL